MSDEPVLSQEDAQVAAFFRRMASWRNDPVLYALHEVKAAGESEGRTAERERIRAKVQALLNEWTAKHAIGDYYTAGWVFALRQVLVSIDGEDTPHE
jgi:hypothetical protein